MSKPIEKKPISSAVKTPLRQAPITKLYLRVPTMDCEQYRKAKNLVEIFEGTVRVIFYDTSTAQYVQSNLTVDASSFVLDELSSVLGKENVVAK